jgi:hypothetical protein
MLAIGALASSHFSAISISVGGVNRPPQSPGEGPLSNWLVRSWFTGPGGQVLSPSASARVDLRMLLTLQAKIRGIIVPGNTAASRWLSLHHYTFWVSYQPASRFCIFQGIEGAVLIGLAALLALATVRVVRHRA